MIILLFLILLFAINIVNALAEDGIYFYKDGKFWLSVFSLCVLTTLISQGLGY